MHQYDMAYNRWKRSRLKRRLLKLFVILLLCATALYFALKNNLSLHHFALSVPETTSSVSPQLILPDKTFEKNITQLSFTSKPTQQPPAPKPKEKERKNATPLLLHSQQVDLKELKQKFTNTPKASIAILIAKIYYQKGEYKRAKEWAYRANELDKNSEESWLLFAKSLAKMNKTQKAQEILRLYIKQSGSKKATILLQEIQKGSIE